jgi:hypothetical protein
MSAPIPATTAPTPSRPWGDRCKAGLKAFMKEAEISAFFDVITLGVFHWWQNSPHWKAHRAEITKHLQDRRVRLMRDIFVDMPREETYNLRRRHREVIEKYGDENLWVALLCKLTDGDESGDLSYLQRRQILAQMNKLSDWEFDQALQGVHHDVVQQKVRNGAHAFCTAAAPYTSTLADQLKTRYGNNPIDDFLEGMKSRNRRP